MFRLILQCEGAFGSHAQRRLSFRRLLRRSLQSGLLGWPQRLRRAYREWRISVSTDSGRLYCYASNADSQITLNLLIARGGRYVCHGLFFSATCCVVDLSPQLTLYRIVLRNISFGILMALLLLVSQVPYMFPRGEFLQPLDFP